MARATVRITRNFARNLDTIESFLTERDAQHAFGALIAKLFEEIMPNLERFPEMGVDFLARRPGSAEGVALLRELRAILQPGASIREYISGDYLMLYVVHGKRVALLSVKHHLQLSFDLRGHWEPSP